MKLPEEATLLRIFLGESNRWKGKPLYEALVMRAREMHLAGATVLRGSLGFGATSRLHSAKLLRLSGDQAGDSSFRGCSVNWIRSPVAGSAR